MAAKSELDPKVIEAAKTLQHTPWCDEYEKMISGMMYVNFPCYCPLCHSRRFVEAGSA